MKVFLLLMLLPVSAIAAPFSPVSPVFETAMNIHLQRGIDNQGRDTVFAYWETYGVYGQTIRNCSITLVEDFLKNIEVKKTLLESASTTPGAKWSWTIPPSNLNPWCLQ